jgi:cytochrome b561
MYLQYVLYALVMLHAGAAFYHHYVMKDGLMGRMWGLRA